MTKRNDNDSTEWISIAEIALIYRRSKSWARGRLKGADGDAVKGNSRGPIGLRYRRDFVVKRLGDPLDDSNFAYRMFSRGSPYVGIIRLETERIDEAGVIGLLASRRKAREAYELLLAELLEHGSALRIRVLSGTDIFDTHRETVRALESRAEDTAHAPTRVLLLSPFGPGARTRRAAESQELEETQFDLDAYGSWSFIRHRHQTLRLEARWSATIPQSFLVWSEEFAIVESYDIGASRHSSAGCIGRVAPILVVKGGSDYHSLLRDGFDLTFDSIRGDEEVSQRSESVEPETFQLEEISDLYQEKAWKAPVARTVRSD